MSRQFNKTLNKLAKGVPFCYGEQGLAIFQVQFEEGEGCRGFVIIGGKVLNVWSARKLDTLRRIACGYHSSLCRAFGAARQYKGL